MKEQGIIIFEDGTNLSFGTYYCQDQIEYLNTPEHEESFKKEILSNMHFKLSDYVYDDDFSFYQNSLLFSLQGMMIIVNNQLTTDSETQILAYLPSDPTEEQINSLKTNKTLQAIEIQRVYEFNSNDFDDYIKYDSFNEYINKKNVLENNQK